MVAGEVDQVVVVAPQEVGSMTFLVVLVLAGGFVLWYYLTYNSLVAHRNATDQSWSNVEVELKRRFDLIENLVGVVKGYAAHERGTLEKIVSLRRQADDLRNPAQAQAAQQQMSSALVNLIAIAESYPQLKADSQYLNLQSELTTTENRIAERRNAYNQSVNMYSNRLETFPSNILASAHGFTPKQFFDEPDELVTSVPKVNLQ